MNSFTRKPIEHFQESVQFRSCMDWTEKNGKDEIRILL